MNEDTKAQVLAAIERAQTKRQMLTAILDAAGVPPHERIEIRVEWLANEVLILREALRLSAVGSGSEAA